MIDFFYKTEFELENPEAYGVWIKKVIESENKILGDISYSFVDDEELDELNQEYLNHTDYTDIISFDMCVGNIISGDIFISLDRVKENAHKFDVSFLDELRRVMVHGVLHYCGYNDSTVEETCIMREKENDKMKMFHVEH